MEKLIASMATAAHGLSLQSARLRVTAENMANADTPGYHRKILTFETVATGDGGTLPLPGPVTFSRAELPRIHDPSHPMADAEGYYEGSNVELMLEVADAREAQRSYEANLRMLDQARQMAAGLLDLLRR
ncbi:MAG: flagellar basal body rod protein FlgC [Paracoccaceae bacterium]|nr:MAG: flagellar basal body rod protein FlgC [Alphaproteobacteria bacterium]GIX15473.1 MAG: flagellar basal body rod protein FlgC [Paracoccaceae bacterium]